MQGRSLYHYLPGKRLVSVSSCRFRITVAQVQDTRTGAAAMIPPGVHRSPAKAAPPSSERPVTPPPDASRPLTDSLTDPWLDAPRRTAPQAGESRVIVIASPKTRQAKHRVEQQRNAVLNKELQRVAESRPKNVDALGECVVRVDDRPDQRALSREVRLRSMELLCQNTFVDACLVWFVHVLLAEQLLLLASFHGLHDMPWHFGPKLTSNMMMQSSRVGVVYWLLGVATLSGLLFVIPVFTFYVSYEKFGREASYYLFSRRSGLFSVAFLANPGMVLSAILLFVFHLPCCSAWGGSDTREFLVFLPVTLVIGAYFSWEVYEVNRAKRGSDLAFLRFKLFPADMLALLCLKALLLVLAEIMIFLKLQRVYDVAWIHVIAPLLAMFGIILVQAMARGEFPYRCCQIEMELRYELELIAVIDSVCLGTEAILVAYKLDHPAWVPWGGALALPIVALFVLHTVWFVLDFFRRLYATPSPPPNYITWLEPVLVELDMDDELQYFEANITWACPSEDDKLGAFERFEVEIAQVPFSRDPTDDHITYEIGDVAQLEWISVYSGPDTEITASNLDAFSLFVIRIHGKKTASGAGLTGPIRKMTSPAMTAAVMRTKTGALSPVQLMMQVQSAKITALKEKVQKLESSQTNDRQPGVDFDAEDDDAIVVDFESRLLEKQSSLDNDQHAEYSLISSRDRSILPSVAEADAHKERQSQLKNYYNWRRFVEVQAIQDGAKQPSPKKDAKYTFGASSLDHLHAYQPLRPAASQTASFPASDHPANDHGLPHPSTLHRDPAATVITVHSKLGIDFESIGTPGSAQRVAFGNELRQNLANASGLPPNSFVIKRLSPGSVFCVLEIHPDSAQRGPDPMSAARDLEEQLMRPASLLRRGSLTRFVTSISIIGESQASNHSFAFSHFASTPKPENLAEWHEIYGAWIPPAQPETHASSQDAVTVSTSPGLVGSLLNPMSMEKASASGQRSHAKGHGAPDFGSTPEHLLEKKNTFLDNRGSIGLLLEQHKVTGNVFIKNLMPGGPAQNDGRLRAGDRLLAVDGIIVNGVDLPRVFQMIKGAPGTEARLRIQRGTETRDNFVPNPGLPSFSSPGGLQVEGSEQTILDLGIERVDIASVSQSQSRGQTNPGSISRAT